MMRQFNIFIFSIYFEKRSDPIIGIAITDTLENAMDEIYKKFENIEDIEYKSTLNWLNFKSMFDISTWPLEYQVNNDGWFEENTFYEACQLGERAMRMILDKLFKTRVYDINLN